MAPTSSIRRGSSVTFRPVAQHAPIAERSAPGEKRLNSALQLMHVPARLSAMHRASSTMRTATEPRPTRRNGDSGRASPFANATRVNALASRSSSASPAPLTEPNCACATKANDECARMAAAEMASPWRSSEALWRGEGWDETSSSVWWLMRDRRSACSSSFSVKPSDSGESCPFSGALEMKEESSAAPSFPPNEKRNFGDIALSAWPGSPPARSDLQTHSFRPSGVWVKV